MIHRIRGADRSLVSELVVALGEQEYEVCRPWGQLPAGIEYTLVSSIAVSDKGRVYVCQRGIPPVVVLTNEGEYVTSWGDRVLVDPHGISVDSFDRVWVVDRDAHEVLAFDPQGKILMRLGERHRPRFQRPFNHPADVAVGPDGEIFVADGYGNSTVHRFSAEGALLSSWGAPGIGPGRFTTPHAIWVDRQGRVLVADRENDRIQLFRPDGAFLAEWPDFYHPMDIYVDEADLVYVTDQIPRLSVVTGDGQLVGRARPVLYGAHGIWGDADGHLYLAEGRPTNRLTKLIRRHAVH